VGDNKNDDEYDMHVWQPGWAMKQSKINGPELHCTKKKAQEIPKDIPRHSFDLFIFAFRGPRRI